MPENKTLTAKFDQVEMNALAFAVKNRMAIIEMKALSFHGETPQSFREYLDGEWEYGALVSLCRKLHID
jgi:hypothetical protein